MWWEGLEGSGLGREGNAKAWLGVERLVGVHGALSGELRLALETWRVASDGVPWDRL